VEMQAFFYLPRKRSLMPTTPPPPTDQRCHRTLDGAESGLGYRLEAETWAKPMIISVDYATWKRQIILAYALSPRLGPTWAVGDAVCGKRADAARESSVDNATANMRVPLLASETDGLQLVGIGRTISSRRPWANSGAGRGQIAGAAVKGSR